MDPSRDLSITTTVTSDYVRYLADWMDAIARLTRPPAHIVIVGNGLSRKERELCKRLLAGAVAVRGTEFYDQPICGVAHAMNVAIERAPTAWAMMLGADDTLLRDAMDQVAWVAGSADVVQLGYEPWITGSRGWPVTYLPLNGVAALDAARIASGPSPFRKALWAQWPFPESLEASWDYGLWLGFAYLGARFRPTPRPAFRYRLRPDGHFQRVGKHRHDDLLRLRRALEAHGVEGVLHGKAS